MSKKRREETPPQSEIRTEFWCRTNPYGDQHGIMYRAARQTGENEYICEGSRMIGHMDDGKSVWVFGGYIDVMNTQGIKIIDDGNVRKIDDDEKEEVLGRFGFHDSESYYGYTDTTSYWFYLKPPARSTGRASRTPGRASRTPSRKASSRSYRAGSRKNRKK